jgi:dolichol-phosphate mannosyltransferase
VTSDDSALTAGPPVAPSSSGAEVLVIIPTYQERENLPLIVGRVRAAVPEAHLLIADDNSPDGTGDAAGELASSDGNVHVLHRAQKEGLGAAYVAGFQWALDAGYEVIVEMDADGSHSPEQLPTLLAALTTADVVLGSRWVAGGQVSNWPKSREILSRGGNAYVRFALGLSLRDATGGYRAYRAKVLRSFDLTTVRSQGYCFQVDLALRSWQHGYRIVEVPITFVERELGLSKMSRAIVLEAFWRVTLWGLQRRLGHRGPAGRIKTSN